MATKPQYSFVYKVGTRFINRAALLNSSALLFGNPFLDPTWNTLRAFHRRKGSDLQELRMNVQNSILLISSILGHSQPPLSHSELIRTELPPTFADGPSARTKLLTRRSNKSPLLPLLYLNQQIGFHTVFQLCILIALSVSKGLCSAFISMQNIPDESTWNPGVGRQMFGHRTLGTEQQGNTAQQISAACASQSQLLLPTTLPHQLGQTLLICATQTLPSDLGMPPVGCRKKYLKPPWLKQ